MDLLYACEVRQSTSKPAKASVPNSLGEHENLVNRWERVAARRKDYSHCDNVITFFDDERRRQPRLEGLGYLAQTDRVVGVVAFGLGQHRREHLPGQDRD